jgi:predicted transcriptional regulator
MSDDRYYTCKRMVNALVKRYGQGRVAKMLHVSVGCVSYWASGARNPSYHAGEAIRRLWRDTKLNKEVSGEIPQAD